MAKITAASISSRHFLIAISLFFTAALNVPFFSKIYGYLWSLPEQHWLFWLALPAAVFAVFYILLSALLIPKIDRWLMALLILGSAVISYTEISFGIMFDHTMIDNFAQTTPAEAKTYINPFAFIYVGLLGVVPAWLVLRVKIQYAQWSQELLGRLGRIFIALLVFGIIAGGFYKDFASTGRNNRQVHQYLVPNQLLYSVGKFAYLHFKEPQAPFQDLTANVNHTHSFKEPELLVLVLGETARAQNFSWNGYPRQTNRYTQNHNFFCLGAVESCGTATGVSVPCMF